MDTEAHDDVPLRRVLSLPLLTLYGVGTIVGAGFYALLALLFVAERLLGLEA